MPGFVCHHVISSVVLRALTAVTGLYNTPSETHDCSAINWWRPMSAMCTRSRRDERRHRIQRLIKVAWLATAAIALMRVLHCGLWMSECRTRLWAMWASPASRHSTTCGWLSMTVTTRVLMFGQCRQA